VYFMSTYYEAAGQIIALVEFSGSSILLWHSQLDCGSGQ
jgi:hypothetical protein